MKLRIGFVSNSSLSCFICGTWIGENEEFCDVCGVKDTLKTHLSSFIDFFLSNAGLSKEQVITKYIKSRFPNENPNRIY
jgi:hypothetical protein